MKVALTGTPGTGKTSVAEAQTRFEVVDLKQLAEDEGCGSRTDAGEFEVDVDALSEVLAGELDPGIDYMLEGHFAHRLEADLCVVLRCRPDELEERLRSRGYPEQKIHENLEAEAMDLILQEASIRFERLMEVDTTGREPLDVAGEMVERLESGKLGVADLDFSEWL